MAYLQFLYFNFAELINDNFREFTRISFDLRVECGTPFVFVLLIVGFHHGNKLSLGDK